MASRTQIQTKPRQLLDRNFVNKLNQTKSIEQNPREADSSSAEQAILRLLWNREIYYRVRKNPSLNPVLSHINQIDTLPC